MTMFNCLKHGMTYMRSCPICDLEKEGPVSSEAEKRAVELAKVERPLYGTFGYRPEQMAFVRFIKHVSDVAERITQASSRYQQTGERSALTEIENQASSLILPKPADPLYEAISAAIGEHIMPGAPWERLGAELQKRSLAIVRIKDES